MAKRPWLGPSLGTRVVREHVTATARGLAVIELTGHQSDVASASLGAMLRCNMGVAMRNERAKLRLMSLHQMPSAAAPPAPSISPVASDRVRALAVRVMEGAPALTAGEMRELAEAIVEHNKLSEAFQ